VYVNIGEKGLNLNNGADIVKVMTHEIQHAQDEQVGISKENSQARAKIIGEAGGSAWKIENSYYNLQTGNGSVNQNVWRQGQSADQSALIAKNNEDAKKAENPQGYSGNINFTNAMSINVPNNQGPYVFPIAEQDVKPESIPINEQKGGVLINNPPPQDNTQESFPIAPQNLTPLITTPADPQSTVTMYNVEENKSDNTIGKDFGKLGVVVNNPDITVDWKIITDHANQKMTERNVNQDMVNEWVKNGIALKQSGNKFLVITQEGAAVITNKGKLITTYPKEYFDENIKGLINTLFKK
jgi:hypothetical protein